MNGLDSYLTSSDFNNLFKNKDIRNYWRKHLTYVRDKNIDTWDAQWSYTILRESGITIIPNVNLISNIGFGVDATHTKKSDTPLSMIPVENIGELIHPKNIVVNEKADEHLFYTLFYKSLPQKFLSKIKSVIGM